MGSVMSNTEENPHRLTALDLKRLASKTLAQSLRKVRLPRKPNYDYKKLDDITSSKPYQHTIWKPIDITSMHTEANPLITFPYGVPYSAEVQLAEEILKVANKPKPWYQNIFFK